VVTGSSPVIQPGSALTTTEPGTFTYSMPALSVTVIVPS